MNRIIKPKRSYIRSMLKLFILLTIIFNFILADFGNCQEQRNSTLKNVPYLIKDSKSGKVKLFQLSNQKEKIINDQRIDKLQINKEIQKFKKISNQHNIYEKIYKQRKLAEKEKLLKQESNVSNIKHVKLFGKPTPFYKTPMLSERTNNSFHDKVLLSNVLINGKSHDTISIHDSFTLSFSFTANFLTAMVNIYVDVDNNGLVSSDDFLLGTGLVMDNSDLDEDQTEGSYRITFKGNSSYSSLESTLIFEVNDYQSISQAIITVKQKPSDRIILGTLSPPLKNMIIETDFNDGTGLYVITDSLGKIRLNVQSGQTQASLSLFDVTGISNGYLKPEQKTVIINRDTTEVHVVLTPAVSFIEGYVRDQDGNTINNVVVQDSYDYITRTDSNGYYKLGVMEGDLYLYLDNVSSDYMKNSYSERVTVSKNSTIQNNFILLKSNNSISGKVVYNSNGIGGIPIEVYTDSLNNFLLSSADGSYEIPVYKSNSYTILYGVSVSVPPGYYVTIPTHIGVLPGAVNINFEIMKVTGGIQGRITDSRTNESISNAYIFAYGNDSRGTYSNDSGYYRISLLPGYYQIYVNAESYFSFATQVYVSTTMVTNSVALVRSGSFSGSIKDEEGNPINNALIMATDSSGNQIGYGYTYQNGNYQISGLTTSKYRAYVTANNYVSQWYNQVYDVEDAAFFQVIEGYNTSDINFVLSKGGSISGKVVDKLGNPISEAWVEVYVTLFNEISYTRTNDSGYYLATGLATGRYYVRASGSEYIEQWYNGAINMENASMVNVVINENTSDINFVLTLGSSISGTVKNKNNIGIQYADIFVFDSTLIGINYYASTNESGYYIAKPLQANKKFFVNAVSYDYVAQWYSNVSTADSATPIILQEEEKRENIDFILSKGGEISGRVLSSTGKPLHYATIMVEKKDGSYLGYVNSDYQGYYSVPNLPPGNYFAKAENYLYEEQWYYHKTSRNQADPIPVKMEDTTENINFDLHRMDEGDSDSLIITIALANIPDTLNFSQSFVYDYLVDYTWGVNLNADGIDTTGENGCELQVCLLHYKQPGELPFQASIIDGTMSQVTKFEGNFGYVIYSDFPVQISGTDKNSLLISLPMVWSEINNINDSTKYFSVTYYYASDGIYQDKSNVGYGGKKITDAKGDVKYSFIDIVSTSWEIKKLVGVSEDKVIPEQYSLYQNYPNPFNPTTTISFDLPEKCKVQIKIFNILGEEVKNLINEEKAAGHYDIQWNAGSLASGVYFYRLQAGNYIDTKKLILMK